VIAVFANHLDALDQHDDPAVIRWASPVPYFGHAASAAVATVGINPSDLEFADESGNELDSHRRRLPTLRSLGLRRWADANSVHLRALITGCDGYFQGRPYDRWFRVLDQVLAPAGFTYYGLAPTACHIDLVAFATRVKWGALDARTRERLLDSSRESFALLLRSIGASLLVLNGRSVVDAFERAALTTLEGMPMPDWDLPRPGGRVRGVGYVGSVSEIAGVPLERTVTVAGFNHNLQSSFGVTASAMDAIGEWVATLAQDVS
jgi:hypothetical protein